MYLCETTVSRTTKQPDKAAEFFSLQLLLEIWLWTAGRGQF